MATADVSGQAMFSATGTDHQNVHVHVRSSAGDTAHSVKGAGHGHGD